MSLSAEKRALYVHIWEHICALFSPAVLTFSPANLGLSSVPASAFLDSSERPHAPVTIPDIPSCFLNSKEVCTVHKIFFEAYNSPRSDSIEFSWSKRSRTIAMGFETLKPAGGSSWWLMGTSSANSWPFVEFSLTRSFLVIGSVAAKTKRRMRQSTDKVNSVVLCSHQRHTQYARTFYSNRGCFFFFIILARSSLE